MEKNASSKRHRIIEEDLSGIYAAKIPLHAMAGKTVLISGASGFLPAYMVETLLYANERCAHAPTRVVALVRNCERARARFFAYQDRRDLQIVHHDASSKLEWEGDVHFIIHAASQTSPTIYGIDPIGTILPNVFGTQYLLELAHKKSVEGFLFISSAEAYGMLPSGAIPTTENQMGYLDPIHFRSCYGESKRLGENLCAAWFHQHGVPAKVVRPFHTYGPGMKLHDGRAFCDFVRSVVEGKDLVVNGTGRATRTFCYLASAVEGYFKVLLEGAPGCVYNIGSDSPEISISDLAHLIAKLFPEKKLTVKYNHQDQGMSYVQSPIHRMCPNIDRARALGWNPKIGLEEGFIRTILSYLPDSHVSV